MFNFIIKLNLPTLVYEATPTAMDTQSLATTLARLREASGREAFQEALSLLPALPASDIKPEGKRRGPKPLASLSEEELAARAVRKAERAAKKAEQDGPTKPKRVLTPEHLAKLQASAAAARAAKKAAKEALKASEAPAEAEQEATETSAEAEQEATESDTLPGDWGAIAGE